MPNYHYPPLRLAAAIVFIIGAVLAICTDPSSRAIFGLLFSGLGLWALS